MPEYGRFYTYLKWHLRLKKGLVTVSVVDINSSSVTIVLSIRSSNSKVYAKTKYMYMQYQHKFDDAFEGSACSIYFVFTRVHV